MKKIYSVLFLVILFSTKTIAQSNCSSPFPFVSGSTNTYVIPNSGPLTDMSNDYGCFPGTGSSAQDVTWIYLGICSSGNILIYISSAGPPIDLDFVAWGPLTAPTNCGLSASDVVDCSFSTATTETVTIPTALVGQYYKIMVSNFSGTPSGSFTLTQTGGTGDACISTLYACPGIVPTQQICQVTTNPTLNQNIIIWEKDTNYTASYIIQKETTTMGVYATIATVMNNDTSAYIDSVSNPMIPIRM